MILKPPNELRPYSKDQWGHKQSVFLCVCGVEFVTRPAEVRAGRTQSCGCLRLRRVTRHGQAGRITRTPLYRCWQGMMTRCENPNYHQYKDYGGRGISVWSYWRDARRFLQDIESRLGPRPPGYTLDRINNDGNYEPNNVRWASRLDQARNRRCCYEKFPK